MNATARRKKEEIDLRFASKFASICEILWSKFDIMLNCDKTFPNHLGLKVNHIFCLASLLLYLPNAQVRWSWDLRVRLNGSLSLKKRRILPFNGEIWNQVVKDVTVSCSTAKSQLIWHCSCKICEPEEKEAIAFAFPILHAFIHSCNLQNENRQQNHSTKSSTHKRCASETFTSFPFE